MNAKVDPVTQLREERELDTGPSGDAEAEIRDNELISIRFAGPVTVAGNTFTPEGGPGIEMEPGEEGIAILITDGEGEGWTISDNIIRGYVGGISQQGGSGGDVGGQHAGRQWDRDTGHHRARVPHRIEPRRRRPDRHPGQRLWCRGRQ